MKIQSLKQLEKEKEKLKIKMEVTEHAFFQSLHRSQQLTRQYIWSKIKLPALIVETATKGAQQVFSSTAGKNGTQEADNDPHWLQQAIPLALSVAEAFSKNNEPH